MPPTSKKAQRSQQSSELPVAPKEGSPSVQEQPSIQEQSNEPSEIERLRQDMQRLQASYQEISDAIRSGPPKGKHREETSHSEATIQEEEAVGQSSRSRSRSRKGSRSHSRQDSRSCSPSRHRSPDSTSTTSSSSTPVTELTKQLMQLIPKYDGTGDAQN